MKKVREEISKKRGHIQKFATEMVTVKDWASFFVNIYITKNTVNSINKKDTNSTIIFGTTEPLIDEYCKIIQTFLFQLPLKYLIEHNFETQYLKLHVTHFFICKFNMVIISEYGQNMLVNIS